ERPLEFIPAYLGLLAAVAVVFPMAPDAPDTDVAAAIAGFGIDVNPMNPASRSRAAPVGWAEPGTVVLRTSGTTGTPKGVPLGEERLLRAAGLVARHHGFSPADTVYSSLPLFHINAQVVGVLAALVSGATLAVDDRFHRRGFSDVMDRCGVTVLNAVPAGLDRRVVDEDGATVAPGAAELVEILGPTVVDHYLIPGAPPSRVPARNAAGWLRTGDVGYRDAGGFLHLLGRIDGVINRGGE